MMLEATTMSVRFEDGYLLSFEIRLAFQDLRLANSI